MRTLQHRAWLRISWHPVRASISAIPNTTRLDASRAAIFSFGTQLHGLLRGLVLSRVSMPEPWERVARLDFAERPEGDVVKSVIVEVMGKTSNVVVVDEHGRIVLCAYQVGGYDYCTLRWTSLHPRHVLHCTSPNTTCNTTCIISCHHCSLLTCLYHVSLLTISFPTLSLDISLPPCS